MFACIILSLQELGTYSVQVYTDMNCTSITHNYIHRLACEIYARSHTTTLIDKSK